MKTLALLVAGFATLASFGLHASGDAEAGRSKSMTCTACHGAAGNSPNPAWPNIASQHESYLVAQLMAYRDGSRPSPFMAGIAAGLSDQDIADLAAYYSAQPAAELEADPELVELGARLYRGGNPATGVTACIACHGPTGRGNPAAVWPRVAGQHATYLIEELNKYRSGQRTTDMGGMMRDIARRMTDEEAAAVASYMQGLR